MEANLIRVIHGAGWWTDPYALRRKAIDKELSGFRAELEAQRKKVADAAVEMVRIRKAKNIVDSDPEASNGVLSTADRDVIKAETLVSERRLRVEKLEGQIEWLGKQDPMNIVVALRMLEIDDPRMDKNVAALEKMKAQDGELEAKGMAKTDPEREELAARIQAQRGLISRAFASLQENLSALAEIERKTLAQYEKQFEEAKTRQLQDKQATIEYSVAKARYLNEKKIYEAGQMKYSQMRVDLAIDQALPSGP